MRPVSSGITRSKHVAQRGITLVEALLAFLVVALGMLGVARVHVDLRAQADLARQRTDAARIAGDELEQLRSYAVLAPSASMRSYAAIESASSSDADSIGTPAQYAIERRVAAFAGGQAANIAIAVRWNDRRGDSQFVALTSVIARSDPVLAAALTTAASSPPIKGALGRSARIPLFAKDLGDGRSAFKPAPDATLAFVQDNASGLVTARCTGVATTLSTATMTSADLVQCDTRVGYLLSGTVRFAGAPAMPFEIVLALTGGDYPQAPVCSANPVDDAAAPRSLYHCIVYPGANGRWSGRSTLAATGWRIGTAAGEHRVCRYSSDLDGSGAIDRNIEHPAAYADVDTALAQQNFLVVAGPDPCPAAAPWHIGDSGSVDVYADLSTLQHQP